MKSPMFVKPGTVTLTRSFERIQTELNKRGPRFLDLNEGSDTYNVVVRQ